MSRGNGVWHSMWKMGISGIFVFWAFYVKDGYLRHLFVNLPPRRIRRPLVRRCAARLDGAIAILQGADTCHLHHLFELNSGHMAKVGVRHLGRDRTKAFFFGHLLNLGTERHVRSRGPRLFFSARVSHLPRLLTPPKGDTYTIPVMHEGGNKCAVTCARKMGM